LKIPRDISGKILAKKLKSLGYSVTRQVGSHMRLTTSEMGVHHITVPNHKPIKVGTLSSILSRIADHHDISKAQLVDKLFS
jgi:predicted RNA binding protein YcfA (HicA-like mRNA interferase family)